MSPEYIRHIHREETAERADEREFQTDHKAPPSVTNEDLAEYEGELDQADFAHELEDEKDVNDWREYND